MSRNFELLQKLGKEQDVLNPTDNAAAGAAAVAPQPTSTAERIWTPPAKPASPKDVAPSLEPVAALAQQIFIAPAADAPRSVVFASTEPGAGCSWVCGHTAQALAGRISGTICVLDANFADPGLHTFFGLDNRGAGLAQALIQPDPIRNFVRPTSQPTLWMIPAGSPTPESLLASDRMRLRIAELRAEFDFVLLDSPAISVNNDAVALGSFSDGVVLVLKAHSSKRNTAKQAVEEMQAGKAKVLGAVLNQRTYPVPQKIYDWL
jgi:capsular exopolysaccharide synthesis family protein